jgi:MFS family permease
LASKKEAAREEPGRARLALKQTVRALRHRNFRLFLGGQIISVVGTWMQSVALSWYVYRLTNSPFLLGLVGFAGQIPSTFLAPVAGVWADRLNRHRMVIATQVCSMIQALVLAALVLTHRATIADVILLSLFIGLVNAVDVPARQSFLVEMVNGKEDLANAIALNSSMFNAARLVGPSIAGILIGVVGEGVVFLLNGLSYIAVIAALLMMRLEPRKGPAKPPEPVFKNLKEGFAYAMGFRPIRSILLLSALTSLMGISYSVLLPVVATEVLKGGAHTYGFLVAATGVGALAGAVFLAARSSVRGLGRVIGLSSLLFSSGLILLSFSRNLWLSTVLLLLAGIGLMSQMASSNTILQTLVEDDMRGRIMSLYTVAFMGMIPLGSLLSGALATRIGTPRTLLVAGVSCALGGLAFLRGLPALRREIRPVYARLGIIPEVASGLESASQRPPS